MPTIFSHAVFAAVSGTAVLKKPVSAWFWLLTALCSIIPDADVIGLAFGIRYNHPLGHRGLTHSLLFAVFFGTLVAFFVHKYQDTGLSMIKLMICFSLATFSHPLLDMLTDGGLGVALFAPLTNERYFFPWRPVEVSPIGVGFFSRRGLDVIFSEIIWIWIPALMIFLSATALRKISKRC